MAGEASVHVGERLDGGGSGATSGCDRCSVENNSDGSSEGSGSSTLIDGLLGACRDCDRCDAVNTLSSGTNGFCSIAGSASW